MTDISDCIFAVKGMTSQYPAFSKAKLEELTNKIIIDSIHDTMRQKGFAKNIIENTYLKSVDITTGDITITSDHISENVFDSALAHEEGTKDHYIKPKNKKMLSWISNGVRRFSAGRKVSGIKAEKIIEKTIKSKTSQLQKAWDIENEKYLREGIFGSQ